MEHQTLYEDDQMLAVDKPAGMVVHPTYKNPAGTLLDAIRARGVPRASIVGRLDKFTSGVVIVAKHPAAHAALQRALAAPDAEKEYLAIVRGRVEHASGRIELRIRVDERDRRRVAVSENRGAPSVTLFERVAAADDLTLLKCRPLTGRRHQIRAHLAAMGWPIVGDAVYGSDGPAARHALHARRVAFDGGHLADSQTGPYRPMKICIEAGIPDYFGALLTLLS